MSRLVLTEYDISMETGFLPEDPLTRLPPYFDPWNNLSVRLMELVDNKTMREEVIKTRLPPYFDPWNNLSVRLMELVDNKTMREEVIKLPVLDYTKLNGPREVKLGHLQLTMMTTGYLWQNGPEDTPKVLPKCLAVPLYGIYEKFGIRPILTYADILLNNTVLKDPNGNTATIIDACSVKEEWDWFIGVSYMVECDFAQVVPAVQNVLDGIDEENEEKITVSLQQISEAVKNMQKTSTLFHKKNTTENFLKITDMFKGYEAVDPSGLIFEGVSDEPVKMKGANAGQTVIFKTLDTLLGIEHPKDRSDYLEEITKYSQPSHRNFIKAIGERPKQLKPIVEASSNSNLKEAYNSLIQSISSFRTYHIQLVTKYFVQAIKKHLPEEAQEKVKPFIDFTMQFLKGMRDDSKQASSS